MDSVLPMSPNRKDKTSKQPTEWTLPASISHKNIKLEKSILQEVLQMTSLGSHGCLFEHCTVTGIALYSNTLGYDSSEELSLLIKIFRNLKQYSPKGGLTSLHLRVAVGSDGPDKMLVEPDEFISWGPIWSAAQRTFTIVMEALDETQLPILEHLDIFDGIQGCSLASDVFMSFAEGFPYTDLFGTLKKLSLSLSLPYEIRTDETERDNPLLYYRTNARVGDLLIPQDIFAVSRLMPKVESLNLHWYNIRNHAIPRPNRRLLLGDCLNERSMRLKECTLRGLEISQDYILDFIQTIQAPSVTLRNINLIFGTYKRLFAYMASPDSPITSYHLEDLREGLQVVFFDVPGEPRHQYTDLGIGPSILTRGPDKVKKPLTYRFAMGRCIEPIDLIRVSTKPSLIFTIHRNIIRLLQSFMNTERVFLSS